MTGKHWDRLGDHIRAELRRRDMSQQDLADQTGYTKRSINSLVNGRESHRWPACANAVEEVFGWSPGTARRIVYGEPLAPDEISIDAARELVQRFAISQDYKDTIDAILDVAARPKHVPRPSRDPALARPLPGTTQDQALFVAE